MGLSDMARELEHTQSTIEKDTQILCIVLEIPGHQQECALHREADRVAIQQAGGFPVLVALLGFGPTSELTEYSVAVLGNLAAGGHALKDAIRDVRPPCVQLCCWLPISHTGAHILRRFIYTLPTGFFCMYCSAAYSGMH